MENVSPTRTELLTKKSQIKLAQQGAELLRNKRESLVREFLDELKQFQNARNEMLHSLLEAEQSLMRAYSVDGEETVISAALAARRPVEIEVEQQNIWGTRIADVKSNYQPRTAQERPYSAASSGSSVRIDDAAERFEVTLEHIIKIAPIDRKLRRLADEIRKTSRRVNALEQRLLPELNEQVKYIRGVLDQREREDIFRLKRLKQKR
jgi:V/A-type H+-transporting ATPase subunit D